MSTTPEQVRRVLMLITGGTICMQDSPDGLIPTKDFVHNLLVPHADYHDRSPVGEMHVINESGQRSTAYTIRPPPRTKNLHEYECSVLEFQDLIDSSSMNGTYWNQIATTLHSNWQAFDAFVILHGTDTLAYTAAVLAFILGRPEKTVIVTGSQLSMYAPHNDAHDNLLDSLTLAASYDIPEVSVVFHHHLYRATRVTKVSAYSLAAFTTPNARPLAKIHAEPKESWSASLHSPDIKLASKFGVCRANAGSVSPCVTHLDTSRVAVLKVYPGINGELIKQIVQIPHLGGLILETFGAGNVPLGSDSNSLLEILTAAVQKGIVVVSVTQCLTGSVTSAYESARKMERRGIVTGLDMTTEAAYTKLVYLLSRTGLSQSEIASSMRKNLCGELTSDLRNRAHSQGASMP